MIDASRSPRPLWRRLLLFVLVATLIAVLAWAIWFKELHHRAIDVRTLVHFPSLSALIPAT